MSEVSDLKDYCCMKRLRDLCSNRPLIVLFGCIHTVHSFMHVVLSISLRKMENSVCLIFYLYRKSHDLQYNS